MDKTTKLVLTLAVCGLVLSFSVSVPRATADELSFTAKAPWLSPVECQRHYLPPGWEKKIFLNPGDHYLMYTSSEWYDMVQISTQKYFFRASDWTFYILPGFDAPWAVSYLYDGSQSDAYPKYLFSNSYDSLSGARIDLFLPEFDPDTGYANDGVIFDLCRGADWATPTPFPPGQTESAIPSTPTITTTQTISPTATCDPTGPTNTSVPLDPTPTGTPQPIGCFTMSSRTDGHGGQYIFWHDEPQASLGYTGSEIDGHGTDEYWSYEVVGGTCPEGVRFKFGSPYVGYWFVYPSAGVTYFEQDLLPNTYDAYMYYVRLYTKWGHPCQNTPFEVELCRYERNYMDATNTPEPLCPSATPTISTSITATPGVECWEGGHIEPGESQTWWGSGGWVEIRGFPAGYIEIENYGHIKALHEPFIQAPFEGKFTVTGFEGPVDYRICPGSNLTPVPTETPTETPTGDYPTPTHTPTHTPIISSTSTPTVDPSIPSPTPTPPLECGADYHRVLIYPCPMGVSTVHLQPGHQIRLSKAVQWGHAGGSLSNSLAAGIYNWQDAGDFDFCVLDDNVGTLDECYGFETITPRPPSTNTVPAGSTPTYTVTPGGPNDYTPTITNTIAGPHPVPTAAPYPTVGVPLATFSPIPEPEIGEYGIWGTVAVLVQTKEPFHGFSRLVDLVVQVGDNLDDTRCPPGGFNPP